MPAALRSGRAITTAMRCTGLKEGARGFLEGLCDPTKIPRNRFRLSGASCLAGVRGRSIIPGSALNQAH
jgi:hypothetical protein